MEAPRQTPCGDAARYDRGECGWPECGCIEAEAAELQTRLQQRAEGVGFVSPVVHGQCLDTIRDLRLRLKGTVPAADLAELIAAATECAQTAEGGVSAKYWKAISGKSHPGYAHDTAPVRRLRAAVAKVQGKESGQ